MSKRMTLALERAGSGGAMLAVIGFILWQWPGAISPISMMVGGMVAAIVASIIQAIYEPVQ